MKLNFLAIVLAVQVASTPQGTAHFPIRTDKNGEGVSAFPANWYGGILKKMDEPALPGMTNDDSVEAYRIVILPTWGPAIAVRVEANGKTFHLISKLLRGQSGFKLENIPEIGEMELNVEDSQTFRRLLTEANFFETPSSDEVRGADGDEFVMEGVAAGKYHVVARWCAGNVKTRERGLKPLVELTKFLFKRAKLADSLRNKGTKIY